MFKLVLVSALLAVACGLPRIARPRLDGRIVGGENTTIEENPHQISLQYYGSHLCGGSIISEKYVVTAAHCTDDATAKDLTIRAGSTEKDSGGIIVQVAKVYQHDLYDYSTTDYDISVLELSEPLTLGSSIGVIALPNKDEIVKAGEDAVCTGWGALEEGGDPPILLQAVTLQIVSNKDCNDVDAYDGEVTERMICAAVNGGGKDSCQGDSGGPLVSGGKLVGIVSWGYGCAHAEYPGVYASVANLRDHITENAGI